MSPVVFLHNFLYRYEFWEQNFYSSATNNDVAIITNNYADSHLADTATTAGAAADKAASNKEAKYRQLAKATSLSQ